MLLVLAAGVGGCASVERVLPSANKAKRAEEVRELKQRVRELQQQATMAEVELERLRRRVAELEAQEVAPETGSSAAQDLSAAPAEGSPVSEFEPVAWRAERVEEIIIEEVEPNADQTAPEERSTVEVAEPDLVADPPTVPDADPSAAGVGERIETGLAEALSAEGQVLYDRGYTSFHQGRYLDAETTFQQFLSSFGGTDLGDNAQFWIGEARYARGDLSAALAAYREVVSRYPTGNKVPDALLKAADCHRGLGDLDGARRGYQEVMERFPAVAAAAVAEDRLRELE